MKFDFKGNPYSSYMKLLLLLARNLTLLITFCLFSTAFILGQEIDTTGVSIFQKNSDAVFLKKEEAIKIKIDNNQPVVEENFHEETYYTKNNSSYSSNKAIYYSDQLESIEKINAFTWIMNGTSKGKYPVKNINTKDFLMRGIFYHDFKSKEFVFPNIQESAIGIVNYKKLIKFPQLINKFYFSESVPVLHAKFSVSFPKSLKLNWKIYNCENCTFSESENKDIITYCWQAQNVPKDISEKNDPSLQYTAPHIVIYIENYISSANQKVNVLSSPEDLHTWFVSFLNRKDFAIKDELIRFTNELIKDCKTDQEKAMKIFEWVQRHIEYEAFEDGLKGYIPDCEANVFSKRYGDCKGIANLVVEMLRIAGLKAYHTWIGSRAIPYTFEDLPTPLTTNHMIATLNLNEKLVFLDATDSYNTFLLPSGFIQGKEAMVSFSDKDFKIVKVPEVAQTESKFIDSTLVTINEGKLTGKTKLFFTGLSKSVFAHKVNSWEKDNNQNKMLTSYLNMGNNKIQLDSLLMQNVFEPNKTTFSSFRFTLTDYLKSTGDKYFINLNLDKQLSDCIIDTTKRKHEWWFDHKYTHVYVTTLTIPKGYELNALPGNSSFSDDEFGYTIQYSKNGNNVELKKIIYINTLLLKRETFGTWNKMLTKLLKAYQENIVLQKINPIHEK